MNAAATKGSGFDDMKDDLDALTWGGEAAPAAGPVVYRSTCKKCHGTGSFGRVSALGHSKCTLCGGTGFLEYKHDEAHRNARKERRAARKDRKAAEAAVANADKGLAWELANPEEAHWLNTDKGDFAASLRAALVKWGSLTDNQLKAVRVCMARAATRIEEQAVRATRAQAVDVTSVEQAFAKASAKGLRTPKLRAGQFVFSMAPATGRNAGSIYVKGGDEGAYLGKITAGTFHPSRECTPAMQAELIALAGDLLGAAVSYGRLTGRCSICNRKLTDPVSVENGIGPICQDNFFGA